MADWLVVGLGNPGAEYAGTRHNAGADVVAVLAARHGGRLRNSKEYALTTDVRVGSHRVALAFPQTYMNESGRAVGALARRHTVTDPAHIIVVHDELDLPIGRIQVKEGGGLAGHNGLKSIRDHLHSAGFLRVRIGIGKPPGRRQGVEHVLRRPSRAEREELDVTVQEAADAVECIISDGVAAAMNRYNQRPPSPEDAA
jgi:PTH1 family peptidyl-tRNA hydrolase